MRVPYEKLKAEFKRVLLQQNFDHEKAEQCAAIFAENSLVGVYSHGLNRFPGFVNDIKGCFVVKDTVPVKEGGFGAMEQWNGHFGPGMLNARFCMDRAISLAKESGIGCVAVKNTNHWMRGGTYGRQAADAGMIGICFTNTLANMPPWGGIDPRLGNNPLVIAVPRAEGHVILDMALSQFSMGKLNQYKNTNEALPLPGGYDTAGKLTTDAAAIIEARRPLPIGFWKGSGLSMVLDVLATVLTQGQSTSEISKKRPETGVSQVFICIKPVDNLQNGSLIENIINYTKSSRPEAGQIISFPGENMWRTRERNLKEGIPVIGKIWETVLGL